MYLSKKISLLALLAMVALAACRKWDDHIALRDQALNETLMEQISKRPELSRFAELLVNTGLDRELSGNRNYTVWAPSNQALEAVPASVVNDTASLKKLLRNHISGQIFSTRMAADTQRVPLMNGKFMLFFQNSFDEATITEKDIMVKNGVLHLVDMAIETKENIWEFIESHGADYAQNAYINGLNFEAQDPELAELDSINPATGDPVYKPGTGVVTINTFRTKVYDIGNEDSLYTYIVLNDNVYEQSKTEQEPFFSSADPAITESNAAWNVVKDLAIKGMFRPEQLQQALLSRFNVHVTINPADIVETHHLSNGIAYVVNNVSVPMEEKIPSFRIEGEMPFEFSDDADNFVDKIMYRERLNANNGQRFNDIYLNLGSGGANDYVDYITNNFYTTKYKVYWVAFSDLVVSGQADGSYGTDSSFMQIFQAGKFTADPELFVADVSIEQEVLSRNYEEVYLGEYTVEEYNWMLSHPDTTPNGVSYRINPATQRVRLKAPASSRSGVPINLTLDYFKFVPVL